MKYNHVSLPLNRIVWNVWCSTLWSHKTFTREGCSLSTIKHVENAFVGSKNVISEELTGLSSELKFNLDKDPHSLEINTWRSDIRSQLSRPKPVDNGDFINGKRFKFRLVNNYRSLSTILRHFILVWFIEIYCNQMILTIIDARLSF